MFSCEYCKLFKNTDLEEHLPMSSAASALALSLNLGNLSTGYEQCSYYQFNVT